MMNTLENYLDQLINKKEFPSIKDIKYDILNEFSELTIKDEDIEVYEDVYWQSCDYEKVLILRIHNKPTYKLILDLNYVDKYNNDNIVITRYSLISI